MIYILLRHIVPQMANVRPPCVFNRPVYLTQWMLVPVHGCGVGPAKGLGALYSRVHVPYINPRSLDRGTYVLLADGHQLLDSRVLHLVHQLGDR